MSDFPYASPTDFRTALRAKMKALADRDGQYTLDELQRQFAYDRALARLFASADAEYWVLKGAGALLARLKTARHSMDVDVFFDVTDADVDGAVQALRIALLLDLGDFFVFAVNRVGLLREEANGARVNLTASLGPSIFSSFHIDVVVGTAMTGTPDLLDPLIDITIDGLARPRYRTFPVADHLADKLAATVSTFRAGEGATPSSRVKDLVDIVIIASTQEVTAVALRTAVTTGLAWRNLTKPEQFVVPDEEGWRKRYPTVAADAPCDVPTYRDAVELAEQLFNPILDGTADGTWKPGLGWKN